MSTRCRIGYQNYSKDEKDLVFSVYCHSNGYPEGVGEMLEKHYPRYEEAEKICALGDLSTLEAFLYPSHHALHSFENPVDDVTIAYGRDRGDEGVEAIAGDWAELDKICSDCAAQFAYIHNGERWYSYRYTPPQERKAFVIL